jgi:hypothetical protein
LQVAEHGEAAVFIGIGNSNGNAEMLLALSLCGL